MIHRDRPVKQGKSPCLIAFCEANLLWRLGADAKLARRFSHVDRFCVDGIAMLKLAAIHGCTPIERVTGPRFFLEVLDRGRKYAWKHFLYGGAPGVADTLADRMRERFTGVDIVGTHSPPFREIDNLQEDADVLQMIEDAAPHFLWVGLGGPKQELWMLEHRDQLRVPFMLGVGAAFDFHSGNRAWAPKPVRVIGMEWLWRMATGGRITLFRNLRCVSSVGVMVLAQFVKHRLLRRPVEEDWFFGVASQKLHTNTNAELVSSLAEHINH